MPPSYWGIDVIPGVTTRADLVAALTKAAAAGSSRSCPGRQAGQEVRAIWEKLRAVPPGRRSRSINCSASGNERTIYGRRNAINELEDRLLRLADSARRRSARVVRPGGDR